MSGIQFAAVLVLMYLSGLVGGYAMGSHGGEGAGCLVPVAVLNVLTWVALLLTWWLS